MTINQKQQTEVFTELFDRLPEKIAKPQIGSVTQPNIDVAAAMKSALESPLHYPAIGESIFAGDTVAIVLQSGLPHAKNVLQSLLDLLGEISVESSDVNVVLTAGTAEQLGIAAKTYESEKAKLADGAQPGTFKFELGYHTINVQVHDSENPAGHAYLGANADDQPVYVNRILVDADVVIPVGSPSPGQANQQPDCIYPDFSTDEIRARMEIGKSPFVTRWREIELANESLGSFFTIQVVCGPGETIQNIFSGSTKETTALAREKTNALWNFEWSEDVSMIVATIETNPEEQTWDDFAHALITASRVAAAGPIVIWSGLSDPPSPAIGQALMSQFEDSISTELSRTMRNVAAIVNERTIFLKSGLSENVVEELGVGFVQSADEVLRIAEPHESGLLIRDAHRVQVPGAPTEEAESNTGSTSDLESEQ